MLERIESRHFRLMGDQPQRLTLPDGGQLTVRLDDVSEDPRACVPDAAPRRMPFVVTLTALESTGFVDGPCTLDLPELGSVSNIWVGRMASLGRDPNGAYFQIVFN